MTEPYFLSGAGCLLTGDQKPGITIVDTTQCVINWLKTLYYRGARNFLIQNVGLL